MRKVLPILAATLVCTTAAMAQAPAQSKAASPTPAPPTAAFAKSPQTAAPIVTSAKGPAPRRELDYLGLIEQARERYTAAHSVDARRYARLDMQIAVHDFMGLSHNAQDWIGIFKGSKQTHEGTVSLAVEIGPGVVIRTWDNTDLDTSYNTLMKPFTPVGKLAGGLQIGDTVMFSANLIGSVISTDDDMILRPQVIAQFQTLQKLDDDGKPQQ
jgi:hypothetical protein